MHASKRSYKQEVAKRGLAIRTVYGKAALKSVEMTVTVAAAHDAADHDADAHPYGPVDELGAVTAILDGEDAQDQQRNPAKQCSQEENISPDFLQKFVEIRVARAHAVKAVGTGTERTAGAGRH